jgi:hypothetical protein
MPVIAYADQHRHITKKTTDRVTYIMIVEAPLRETEDPWRGCLHIWQSAIYVV